MSDMSGMQQFFLGNGDDGVQQDDLHRLLQGVLQTGIDFKCQSAVKANPTSTPNTVTFPDMPNAGITCDGLLDEFKRIAAGSANWGSPNFMGFPDAGNSVPALCAAVLTPFINQNLANQDICSPLATFVEMETVHWLRQNMGFKVESTYRSSTEIGGVLTLGGCLSNTVAMMAAREYVFPGSRMTGVPVLGSEIVVLVPDVIEHYSIRSAMAWLSLGEKNVLRVPVDAEFRMDLQALDSMIDEQRTAGKYIIACVAYAGDSRSMRVDNLDAIATVLNRKSVWFHVDACHGSQLAFSRTHKHKIKGIELADSVTIDPHKVLWIPNTCSFVLFKNPASLSNISTNSDLILKTQWSLGQVTPSIGSKAFDALKLWATIKTFGRDGIEKLIDGRLALTAQIQQVIRDRQDLVLLNDTDINSCMFVYIPEVCQRTVAATNKALSAADMEKINNINSAIKAEITKAGDSYCHGFNLKKCPNTLWEEDQQVYALRTMNGNPLTTLEHVNKLMDTIVELGARILTERQYQLIDGLTNVTGLTVGYKLQEFMADFFGDVEYQAVAYGSSTSSSNKLLSDVDMMVFVSDDFVITPELRSTFEIGYRNIMEEEGIVIDAEVPFERKQLVSMSVATCAASGTGIRLINGEIASIEKTAEYLASHEMLLRLILNVLTVPNAHLGGSETLISSLREMARESLINLIQDVGGDVNSAEQFSMQARSNGKRSGEEYLGYKERPDVIQHLHDLWNDSQKAKQGCIVLLNGFPGVGKLTIAQAIKDNLPEHNARLIDNHVLIDPAEAIVPGRGPAHKLLRAKVRRVAFEALTEEFVSQPNLKVIMTGCLADNAEDTAVLTEHLRIAKDTNVPFYLVGVTCDREEHGRRLEAPARTAGGKTKLRDENILRELLEHHVLVDPKKVPEEVLTVVEFEHVVLDTTGLTVEQSVSKKMQKME